MGRADAVLLADTARSTAQTILQTERDDISVLTPVEVDAFHTFGFVLIRGLLTAEEIVPLRAEVERALRLVFGEAFGMNTRTDLTGSADEIAALGNYLPLMDASTPVSLGLVGIDSRLATIADQLLGDAMMACPAMATCLVGDTPWHPDGAGGPAWVRVVAYFDSVTAESGALRLIAGSAFGDAAERTARFMESHAGLGPRVPAVAVDADLGDVLVFDPRTWHASFGGRPRLRWGVDYVHTPSPDEYASTRDLVTELSDWDPPADWPVWDELIALAGRSQVAARTVGQLRIIGVL